MWHGTKTKVAKGAILLKFRTHVATDRRRHIVERLGLTVTRHLRLADAEVTSLADDTRLEAVLSELLTMPEIEWAEPDPVLNQLATPCPLGSSPNDPQYQSGDQINLCQIEIDRAWDDPFVVGSGGKDSIIVAVLDSGLLATHEDFYLGGSCSRVLTSPACSSVVVGFDAFPEGVTYDWNGHGTRMAGIIGAAANNGTGVSGVSWNPKIAPGRVVFPDGSSLNSYVAAGLDWAANTLGAQVVNISLAGPAYSMTLRNSVKGAAAQGLVIVAGSGNDGGPVRYPAGFPEVIAVGGVDPTDAYWWDFTAVAGSNWGPELDVVAPAVDIWSTSNDGSYNKKTGTSNSTAEISGLSALLLSQNPDWAAETVYRRITETADKVAPQDGNDYDAAGFHPYMGYGRVNAYRALGGTELVGSSLRFAHLYDARTTLSAPSGANPVARHRFVDNQGGSVELLVSATGEPPIGLATKTVIVKDPTGVETSLPLSGPATVVSPSSYSAGPYSAPATSSFIDKVYVPRAVLIDNTGLEMSIPLPVFTVPGAIPVRLQVSASLNQQVAGGSVLISVRAYDAHNNPIYHVPISVNMVSFPEPEVGQPDPSLIPEQGETGGMAGVFQTSLVLSSKAGSHVLVFAVAASGLEGISTTLTITGTAGSPDHLSVGCQYEVIRPTEGSTLRSCQVAASVYDLYGNQLSLGSSATLFSFAVSPATLGYTMPPTSISPNGVATRTFFAKTTEGDGNITVTYAGTAMGSAPIRIRRISDLHTQIVAPWTPTLGNSHIYIRPQSSDGLDVGGVPLRLGFSNPPLDSGMFLSDRDSSQESQSAVNATSISPGETDLVLHGGRQSGTVSLDLQVTDEVGRRKELEIRVTRDWPQGLRWHTNNAWSPDEILKPPLSKKWDLVVSTPGYWVPAPVIAGSTVFTGLNDATTGFYSHAYSLKSGIELAGANGVLGNDAAAITQFNSSRTVLFTGYGTLSNEFGPSAFEWSSVSPGFTDLNLVGYPGVNQPGSYDYFPVLDGKRLYVASDSLAAYSAENLSGKYLLEPTASFGDHYVRNFTPVCTNGLVLGCIIADSSDASSQGVMWDFGPGYPWAIVKLFAFDQESGRLAWSFTRTGDSVGGEPAYHMLVVARVEGKEYVYSRIGMSAICFKPGDGKIVWERSGLVSGSLTNFPVVVDRNVFLRVCAGDCYAMGDKIIALDALTGVPTGWEYSLGTPNSPGFGGISPLTVAGGFLYFLTKDALNMVSIANATLAYSIPTDSWFSLWGRHMALPVAEARIVIPFGNHELACYGPGVWCPVNVHAGPCGIEDVYVSWDEPPAATYPISGYRVERGSAAAGVFSAVAALPAGTTVYVDTSAAAQPDRWYRVIAIDTDGNESEGCRPVRRGEALVAQAAAFPSTVCSSSPITLAVTVRNAGCGDVYNICGSATPFREGTVGVIVRSRPLCVPSLAPGEATVLTWTCSVGGYGYLKLTVTINGMDSVTGSPVSTGPVPSNTVYVTAGGKLNASLSVQSPVLEGMPFLVMCTITNTGGSDVVDVHPNLTSYSGSASLLLQAGPWPAEGLTLTASGHVTFTWTYTALGYGWASFTVGLTGTTCGGRRLPQLWRSLSLNVIPMAWLEGQLVLYPSPRNTGQMFTVVLTVTNSGDANADLGLPTDWLNSGSTTTTRFTGPSGGPGVLPAGMSRSFTWNFFAGSAPGTVVLTMTLAGTSMGSGTPISTGPVTSNVLTVQRKAELAVSVSASATDLCVGQPVRIGVTVSNTGEAGARNPVFMTMTFTGSARLLRVAGPTPAMSATLQGGEAVTLVWDYTAVQPGTGSFQVVVGATDGNSGAAVYSVPVGRSIQISSPAVVQASVAAPESVLVGSSIQVTATVTNTGGTRVYGMVPSLSANGMVGYVSGPSPPGSFPLLPGASRTFAWTFSATGRSLAHFSLIVQGTVCGLQGDLAYGGAYTRATEYVLGGEWPMWGHDPQNTFCQDGEGGLTPPLELAWSAEPYLSDPVVAGNVSYWIAYRGLANPLEAGIIALRADDGARLWGDRLARGIFLDPFLAVDDSGRLFAVRYDTATASHQVVSVGSNGGMDPVFSSTTGPVAFTVDDRFLYAQGPNQFCAYLGAGGLPVRSLAGAFFVMKPLVVNHTAYVLTKSIIRGGGFNEVWLHAIPAGSGTGFEVAIFQYGRGYVPVEAPISNVHLSSDGQRIYMPAIKYSNNINLGYFLVAYDLLGHFLWEQPGNPPAAGPFHGPSVGGGRISVRYKRPSVTVPGLRNGWIPSLATTLSPTGMRATGNVDLRWGGSQVYGETAKTGLANGIAYHQSNNATVTGPATQGSVPGRGMVQAVDAEAGRILWSPTTPRPSLSDESLAIARGKLYVDGGQVYGPRSVDPPDGFRVLSSRRNSVDINWSKPVLGGDSVTAYEIFRALRYGGLIWAGADQPIDPALDVELIATVKGWASCYADSISAPGLYYYAVRAVTNDGRRSWFTPEIGVVPITVSVLIATPRADTIYRAYDCKASPPFGTLVITGVASDPDPTRFLRYELAYSIGAFGSFTTFNTSPAPVTSVGELGRLYLCALPSGLVTLRLRVFSTDGQVVEAFRPFLFFKSTVERISFCGVSSCTPWMYSAEVFCEHRHPEDVATDGGDFVYIVDSQRQRVERFDAMAHLLLEIGGGRSGTAVDDAALRSPYAAAVAPSGLVYVTDRLAHSVKVFDEDGAPLLQFGRHGKGKGEFDEPAGIARDAEGSFWIADRLNDRIERFTADGEWLKTLGVAGARRGQLRQPTHLAVDGEGMLWIADTGNSRIQRWMSDGTVALSIGPGIDAEHSLVQPTGIVVDSERRLVYVADSQVNGVFVFDFDGSFLGEMGERGDQLGQVLHPGGLGLDTLGIHLYVADTQNSRGQRWLVGYLPPTDTVQPRADLLAPADYSHFVIGSRVSISGRAVDAYFKRYSLSASWLGGSTVISESDQPVWKGSLGEWDTEGLTPGLYEIILQVEDQIGNITEVRRRISGVHATADLARVQDPAARRRRERERPR